jgi:hypothetical protein
MAYYDCSNYNYCVRIYIEFVCSIDRERLDNRGGDPRLESVTN